MIERIDAHNVSVDTQLVHAGACAQIHLPSGRSCVLPHHHRGSCLFIHPTEMRDTQGFLPAHGIASDHERSGDRAEVLVIGAGPAGLSAALCLARFDRRVTVLDAGQGRSTHHQVNRNYLGFPGGVQATRLRELGMQQLANYPTVHVKHAKVERLSRVPSGGFIASGQFGECHGDAVILATGVLDHYPHFDGW